MGIEAILGGASLLSGFGQASAAKKSAKTAAKQAKDELALQTRIYDEGTARLEPWRAAGTNALDAYLYEIGIGPRPTVGGVTPEVTEIRTGGTNNALTNRDRQALQDGSGGAYWMALNKQKQGSTPGSVTGYSVSGKTFQSAAEAEAYAKSMTTGGSAYGGYEVSPMAQYLLNEGVDSIEGSRAAAGGLYSGATLEALENNRRELITADTTDYFNRLLGVADRGQSAAGGQNAGGSAYASGASSAGRFGALGQMAGYQGQADAISGTINDMAGIYGYFNKDEGGNNPMAAYAGSYRPKANPRYA